jgi:hypothetical protein
MSTNLTAKANPGAKVSAKTTKVLPLQSPWSGYTPDMAIPVESPTGLAETKAMIVVAGVLTTDHGWDAANGESDSLPLGNNTAASGWNDGTTNHGAGVVGAVASSNVRIQPVRHLASFNRFTSSGGLGNSSTMAVTADTSGPDVSSVAETGHLFELTGGDWVSREFAAADSAGAKIVGEVPIEGTIANWIDSTVYPLGVTGMTLSAGGSEEIQQVSQSVFVFTNHVGEVMYFPAGDDAGATAGDLTVSYTSYSAYAQQVREVGAAANTDGDFYSGDATIIDNFRAKSVETFDGRVWYANTVEDGVHHGQRLRRSIVGNPLIITPGFEINSTIGGGGALNGVGAGAIDLEQFETPIQRVLSLGDMLAVYSEDGIAFVRRTGSNVAPYSVQYVTLENGLLSPGSVTSISPGKHFAILQDGWYMVSSNGTIEELGLSQPAPLRTGEINYKWKEDFFVRLSQDGVDDDQVALGYDPEEQFVRIGVPMSSGGSWEDNASSPTTYIIPNEVWIYDIRNDRVFLDNYDGVNGQDQSPISWTLSARPTSDIISWADVTAAGATPWNAPDDPGPWFSLSPSFSTNAVMHGDVNGKVYYHDHVLPTRDGDLTQWHFKTIPHDYKTAGGRERVLQRIDLQYENAQGGTSEKVTTNVTAFNTDSGEDTTSAVTESGSISLRRGLAGEMAYEYAHYRSTGDHHQVEMSGTGPIRIHAIDLEFQGLEGRYRRKEGT